MANDLKQRLISTHVNYSDQSFLRRLNLNEAWPIHVLTAAMMSLMMPTIRDIVGLHLLPIATGTNFIFMSFSHFTTLLLSGEPRSPASLLLGAASGHIFLISEEEHIVFKS